MAAAMTAPHLQEDPMGRAAPILLIIVSFLNSMKRNLFFLFLYYFQLRYNFVLLVTEMLQFRGHSNSRFDPVDLDHLHLMGMIDILAMMVL